jgi:hypothetical protein
MHKIRSIMINLKDNQAIIDILNEIINIVYN